MLPSVPEHQEILNLALQSFVEAGYPASVYPTHGSFQGASPRWRHALPHRDCLFGAFPVDWVEESLAEPWWSRPLFQHGHWPPFSSPSDAVCLHAALLVAAVEEEAFDRSGQRASSVVPARQVTSTIAGCHQWCSVLRGHPGKGRCVKICSR